METCENCRHRLMRPDDGRYYCAKGRLMGPWDPPMPTCTTWEPMAINTDPDPPAQPEPGHMPKNPYPEVTLPLNDGLEHSKWLRHTTYEEGRVAGDAVGYARGKAESAALVRELVEACEGALHVEELRAKAQQGLPRVWYVKMKKAIAKGE